MSKSTGLEGDANEGFNADISLTRPSPADERLGLKPARKPSTLHGQAGHKASGGPKTPENDEAELLEKATQPVTGLRMRSRLSNKSRLHNIETSCVTE